MTSKTTGRAASDLLDVRGWASRILGMDDIWTPLMLDAAVSLFGTWAENKLNELDKEGKPVHQLSDLLGDTEPAPDWSSLKMKVADIHGIGVSRRG